MPQEKTVTNLAILAGGGALPTLMASAALARGWNVYMVTFTGQPQPDRLPDGVEVARFPLAKVGQVLAHLRSIGATHVALAGNLNKPGLLGLVPDTEGMKILAEASAKRLGGGDDALLRAVTKRLREAGMTLLPTAELAGDLLAPQGNLAKRKPTQAEMRDAMLGLRALRALGDLDVGQACVVAHGTILGIEGIEGTDALIERCALLRGHLKPRERAGILVKTAKPNQTEAADMPLIGPVTMEKLAACNFVGTVVGAGRTLLLDLPRMVRVADDRHMFIHGVDEV